MLSTNEITLNRLLFLINAVLRRSAAKCDAVEPDPPLPIVKILLFLFLAFVKIFTTFVI